MDPLNPHRANCPPGTLKFDCISVGELPNAPPQPWATRRPNTRSGTLERATLHSASEQVARTFVVYVPAGYQKAGPPSALVVLFDGADLLSPATEDRTQHDTPAIIENLIADSRLPSTVVVFLDNLPGRRLPDLLGNPKLADFLATQLVPWVRAHYNVTREPRKTVIGGFSVGGFAAAYVGLRHSEVFGNVLSQSGAFWWSPEHNGGVCSALCDSGYVASRLLDATTEPNWLARQFSIVGRLPLRFYLYAGTFEVSWGKGGNILEATRHLRDVLRARGYEVHYQQYAAGHDGLTWQGTIADGLVALIGNSRGAVSTTDPKN
jgi:enterochelin esterase family protein